MTGLQRQTRIRTVVAVVTILMLSKLFLPLALWVPLMKTTSFFTGWGPITWQEEVLLHDGRTLIAWRSQTHGGRGEIGQSPIKSQSIRFFIPGTLKLVTWKDKATPDIGIANFDPVALHVKDKVPYLILHPDKCLSYNKWGRPNPPYILLKYKGGDWQQIPMAELPAEFVNVNLVINTQAHEKKLVRKWVVSHEMVAKLNGSLTQLEYKHILRTPLEVGGNSASEVDCPIEVYDGKGGWLGIDWFTSEKSHKACLKVCAFKRISIDYCPCDNLLKTNPKWR